jgi:hypothetical protein
MPNHREALAWRAAEHAIDCSRTDAEQSSHFLGCESLDRSGDYRSFGEIELVNGAMNRVDLDCAGDVKAGLFKSQA